MQVYCAEPGSILEECLMKICCAFTDNLKYSTKMLEGSNLPKFNILFSFYYTKKIDPYIPYAKNIMVDSGAFTLQQSKNKTNYEEYFKNYLSFVKKNSKNDLISGFFEFDIDSVVSYNQVKEYRNKLFEITDKIIPVWHKHQGINEFKKMCNEYGYIGISCVNNRSIKPNAYPKFVAYAHKHNCKIHGLGMLRPAVLNKVPFDSVDGTSWFKGARFGKFNNKKMKSNYVRENRPKLVFIELMEHIRFQEKMYNKWRFYHND